MQENEKKKVSKFNGKKAQKSFFEEESDVEAENNNLGELTNLEIDPENSDSKN